MSENGVVTNFVDYCNLLEQACLDGYIQVVFPAIIALPDVCGSALYEIMDVGKRYKKWVKDYVTPVTRGLEGHLCVDVVNINREVVNRCVLTHWRSTKD